MMTAPTRKKKNVYIIVYVLGCVGKRVSIAAMALAAPYVFDKLSFCVSSFFFFFFVLDFFYCIKNLLYVHLF